MCSSVLSRSKLQLAREAALVAERAVNLTGSLRMAFTTRKLAGEVLQRTARAARKTKPSDEMRAFAHAIATNDSCRLHLRPVTRFALCAHSRCLR